MKKKLIETTQKQERGILVGLQFSRNPLLVSEPESLKELEFLARTAGVEPVKSVLQKKEAPSPAFFIGKGKAHELQEMVSVLAASVVLVDHDLSPTQQMNLERVLRVKVLDRTQVILDIFARRARTSEGKLQVELAQLEYLQPRLKGEGILLSRLGGGIGTRGPGEKKLETDRRHIRRRLATLKEAIERVRKHRELHRKRRKAFAYPLVTLVGYTNAGKSTLLNALCEGDVFVEDKLFATLDPTTRKIVFPDKTRLLLTDTVGFIRKLPHHLITAFRATLEEATQADVLLHVVDASHPHFESQIEVAAGVLKELDCAQKQAVLVFNKIDRLPEAGVVSLRRRYPDAVFISAFCKKNLDALIAAVSGILSRAHTVVSLSLKPSQNRVLSFLYEKGKVLRIENENEIMHVKAEVHEQWLGKLKNLLA